MTFKNSFLISLQENAKRRNWVFVLMTIVYVIYFPVASLVVGLNSRAVGREAYDRTSDFSYFGCNIGSAFIVGIFAVIVALQGYSYLQNRRKLDFYQSVPVNQKKRFFTIWLNGYILFLVSYLPQLLLGLLITASYQTLYKELLFAAMVGILEHILLFSLMYHVTMLAVMLTGNALVTLVMTGILVFYELLVRFLMTFFSERYFTRYVYASTEKILDTWTSPAMLLFKFFDDLFGVYNLEPWFIRLQIGIVSVIFLGISFVVYGLRRVDSCNQAIVFRKFRVVLKYLVIIPISLLFGLFFDAMLSNSDGIGLYIGIIIGTIVFHILFEVIYAYDVKALLNNKRQMFSMVVISSVIVIVFQLDLIGYDSYVPSAKQLKSCSIQVAGERNNSWVNYEEGVYSYNWDGREEYMFIEEVEEIIALANMPCNQDRTYSSYRDYMNVTYRMSNGGVTYRRVYFDRTDVEALALVDAIYENDSFQEGRDPLYSEGVTALVEEGAEWMSNNGIVTEIYDGNKQMELLEALRSDYKKLSYSDRMNMIPISTVAINKEVPMKNQSSYGYSSYSYTYERQVNLSFTYPIYETFTETIGLLEQEGVTLKGEVNAKSVSSIWFYERYSDYEKTIYDQEEIEKVVPYLIGNICYQYYASHNYSYNDDPDHVHAYVESGGTHDYIIGVEYLP